jgi:hypothetical protein
MDAIIVPGGGSQRGREPDTLPVWVLRRLDRAYELWKENPAAVILPLSAGTPHRPNYVTADGWHVLEATSAALYLLQKKGVPASSIYREYSSLDTIGNAFFARVQHADVCGWKKIVVVTSEFHMPRTEAIFRWVFGLPPAPADGTATQLSFISVSDDGIAGMELRREREQQSLATFVSKTIPSFPPSTSLRDLHHWIWTQHRAYCTHEELVPADGKWAQLPQDLKDTY